MAKAQSEPILRASGLALGYGRRPILAGIDLEIAAGEFWCFVGPNGEGKTTMLRAILGEIAPRSGELWMRADLRSRVGIGFVPQRSEPNPTLPTTVREFVALGLVGLGVIAADRQRRLAWALAHAGLQGSEKRSYWRLSGGERQRALIARALVRRPELLVLDEPTSHLDFAIEAAVLDLLAEQNRRHGTSVLLVTHDLGVAARKATHVALFHAGRVQAGVTADVLTEANLQRLYGIDVRAGSGGPLPGRGEGAA